MSLWGISLLVVSAYQSAYEYETAGAAFGMETSPLYSYILFLITTPHGWMKNARKHEFCLYDFIYFIYRVLSRNVTCHVCDPHCLHVDV